MFFVRIGQLVAVLAFLRGLWLSGMGIVFAISNDQAGFRRYVPSKTTGEAIDVGIESIVFAAVIGILCHIALSISRPVTGN